MRIIITGGGGFLGQRVARELLERGKVNDADGNPQRSAKSYSRTSRQPPKGLLDPKVRYAIGDAATRGSSLKLSARTRMAFSISLPWLVVPPKPTSISACA